MDGLKMALFETEKRFTMFNFRWVKIEAGRFSLPITLFWDLIRGNYRTLMQIIGLKTRLILKLIIFIVSPIR